MSGVKQRVLIPLLSMLLLTACGSVQRHYDQALGANGKPNWVAQGTQTAKTEKGRIFLGVGVARIQDELSREANEANLLAREELERMLTRFIEVVARDFIASGKAQAAGFLPNEAPVFIGKMTGLVATKGQVMDHWVDPKGRNIYAIAELDYPQVRSMLATSPAVNAGFREYLNQQGELIFDRIATQH